MFSSLPTPPPSFYAKFCTYPKGVGKFCVVVSTQKNKKKQKKKKVVHHALQLKHVTYRRMMDAMGATNSP